MFPWPMAALTGRIQPGGSWQLPAKCQPPPVPTRRTIGEATTATGRGLLTGMAGLVKSGALPAAQGVAGVAPTYTPPPVSMAEVALARRRKRLAADAQAEQVLQQQAQEEFLALNPEDNFSAMRMRIGPLFSALTTQQQYAINDAINPILGT